jgi:hypothetical protein
MSLRLPRAVPFASALDALSARALLAAICLSLPGLTLAREGPAYRITEVRQPTGTP